jgi:hypothetical protein
MPIWKLTPLDLRDPNWEASSHQGFAVVRARNARDARTIAAKAFDAKTRFRPEKGPRFPPWRRASLVKVERIEDPRYEAQGPAAVLEPSV